MNGTELEMYDIKNYSEMDMVMSARIPVAVDDFTEAAHSWHFSDDTNDSGYLEMMALAAIDFLDALRKKGKSAISDEPEKLAELVASLRDGDRVRAEYDGGATVEGKMRDGIVGAYVVRDGDQPFYGLRRLTVLERAPRPAPWHDAELPEPSEGAWTVRSAGEWYHFTAAHSTTAETRAWLDKFGDPATFRVLRPEVKA